MEWYSILSAPTELAGTAQWFIYATKVLESQPRFCKAKADLAWMFKNTIYLDKGHYHAWQISPLLETGLGALLILANLIPNSFQTHHWEFCFSMMEKSSRVASHGWFMLSRNLLTSTILMSLHTSLPATATGYSHVASLCWIRACLDYDKIL